MGQRGFLAVAFMLCVGCALAGCSNGNCRYGRVSENRPGFCKSRPEPSAQQAAAAVTGQPVVAAVAAWDRAEPANVPVGSVGLNRWGETTFTVQAHLGGLHEYQLVTYDRNGRPTSGEEEYISDPEDPPFPVSEIRADVLPEVMQRLRAAQPYLQLYQAVLNIDAFSGTLGWTIQLWGRDPDRNSITYYARNDRRGLCYENAMNQGPVPGVAPCPHQSPGSDTPQTPYANEVSQPCVHLAGKTGTRIFPCHGPRIFPPKPPPPPKPRVVGPASASQVTGAGPAPPGQPNLSALPPDARRVIECVRAAHGDPTKLTHCH